MLYLICSMIFSVYLAHYGVSHAKYWVSVDCGTVYRKSYCNIFSIGSSVSISKMFKKVKVKVSHSLIAVGAVGVRVPLYLGHS